MKKVLSIIVTLALVVVLFACEGEKDVKFSLNAGVDTIEINETWTDAGAVATINDVTTEVSVSGTVDKTKLGVYVITYSITVGEETQELKRHVTVADQTKPVLALKAGLDSLVVGGSWSDAGVTVTDNSGETLTAVVTGTVDATIAGTYTVVYTATDSSGNTGTISRIVTVLA